MPLKHGVYMPFKALNRRNFIKEQEDVTLQEQQSESAALFAAGIKDGIPICLGYISVAFTFGITASLGGLPTWAAVLMSMTNVTSAGQFAGISLIFSGASMFEMALTQLIINLRYALMSFSLSQKLDSGFTLKSRLLVSFVNTDEVFAVASGRKGEVSRPYMYGLILTPYLGWAGGTLLGGIAGAFLPQSVLNALGIAIYGMFIAIVVPAARTSKSVFAVVAFSVALSCIFSYTPYLKNISGGFVIIICTVIAAGVGALLFPVKDSDSESDTRKEADKL